MKTFKEFTLQIAEALDRRTLNNRRVSNKSVDQNRRTGFERRGDGVENDDLDEISQLLSDINKKKKVAEAVQRISLSNKKPDVQARLTRGHKSDKESLKIPPGLSRKEAEKFEDLVDMYMAKRDSKNPTDQRDAKYLYNRIQSLQTSGKRLLPVVPKKDPKVVAGKGGPATRDMMNKESRL